MDHATSVSMPYRRKREWREMAGWQCLAGRSILRMEASQFGPLAGTTKNTVLRFESGEFVPRRETVFKIDQALRERGVYPTYNNKGQPRGLAIGWKAYGYAYPDWAASQKSLEDIGRHLRSYPPPPGAIRSWKGVDPDAIAPVADNVDVAEANNPESPDDSSSESPDGSPSGAEGMLVDRLEAEQQRLLRELERLRAELSFEADEHDF
jgi:hypothetical protein